MAFDPPALPLLNVSVISNSLSTLLLITTICLHVRQLLSEWREYHFDLWWCIVAIVYFTDINKIEIYILFLQMAITFVGTKKVCERERLRESERGESGAVILTWSTQMETAATVCVLSSVANLCSTFPRIRTLCRVYGEISTNRLAACHTGQCHWRR